MRPRALVPAPCCGQDKGAASLATSAPDMAPSAATLLSGSMVVGSPPQVPLHELRSRLLCVRA